MCFGVQFWLFSIRRIAIKHFQGLDTSDFFCHSRASSLLDQLCGIVPNRFCSQRNLSDHRALDVSGYEHGGRLVTLASFTCQQSQFAADRQHKINGLRRDAHRSKATSNLVILGQRDDARRTRSLRVVRLQNSLTFFTVITIDLVAVSLLTHKLRVWFPAWFDAQWATRTDPWAVYSQSYFAGIFFIPLLSVFWTATC